MKWTYFQRPGSLDRLGLLWALSCPAGTAAGLPVLGEGADGAARVAIQGPAALAHRRRDAPSRTQRAGAAPLPEAAPPTATGTALAQHRPDREAKMKGGQRNCLLHAPTASCSFSSEPCQYCHHPQNQQRRHTLAMPGTRRRRPHGARPTHHRRHPTVYPTEPPVPRSIVCISCKLARHMLRATDACHATRPRRPTAEAACVTATAGRIASRFRRLPQRLPPSHR